MARNLVGVIAGMQPLEPGVQVAASAPRTVGRFRRAGHPALEAAVDRALAVAELEVRELDWAAFAAGAELWTAIYFHAGRQTTTSSLQTGTASGRTSRG